jgi:hypothetical protein
MPRKSYKPEEIVAKLRQVDVLTNTSPLWACGKLGRLATPSFPKIRVCVRRRMSFPLTG